jgi:hypothetical protein
LGSEERPAADAPASRNEREKTMGVCRVKSFTMSFGSWDISWPWSEYVFTTTTIQLPVTFHLVLEEGCSRADCVIDQMKRGRCWCGGPKGEFSIWTEDSSSLHNGWWDGTNWHGGDGSWSWFGGTIVDKCESATFHDKPGFYRAERTAYPLYLGGPGGVGHFDFQTYVKDRVTKAIIAQLTWGLLIDYSAPEKGSHRSYK